MIRRGGIHVGESIRRLRREQHRTQQQIADACGFTKSLLCKIEAGKVMPPVATLVKIGAALGTKVSALLEEGPSARTVYTPASEVRSGPIKTERGYWIFPFATHHRDKRMQPFMFTARKGEVKTHHLAHDGEEFMYVIEGEMTVEVGQTSFMLKSGDSLYFDSTVAHQIIPISKTVQYLNIFV